mmetsp:Transcript_21871/g.30083  ORF Transcript_21871/g.30083 Transcript_21871/m.30083 type:complete len:294 (+) Transcript_21871:31-912(+)
MTNLSGINAVCVGATQGIGRAVAVKLAGLCANVTIIGRNEKQGAIVVNLLKQLNPKGSYSMIPCDVSTINNVRLACKQLKTNHDQLNYLVLSQGIASIEGRQETVDGIDVKMALHYYSRIQFINELLPILRSSSLGKFDSRVLSVLSGGIHSPYTNMNDPALKDSYSLTNAANAAGFYNDLALDQLARNESVDKFSFIHATPGVVRTEWGKDFPAILRLPIRLAQYFATPPELCAERLVNNALLGSHMANGFHVMNQMGQESKKTKEHNDFYRNAVWKHTNEVLESTIKGSTI